MKQDNWESTVLAIATFEQLLVYAVILAALAMWVAIQPPPEHRLPIVVLILAAVGVVVSFVASRRNRDRVNPPAPNPDAASDSTRPPAP